MNLRDNSANLWVLQCAKPAGLGRRIVCDPKPDRVDHQYVREPRYDRLSTGAHLSGFGSYHAQGALYPVRLGRSPRVNSDDLR